MSSLAAVQQGWAINGEWGSEVDSARILDPFLALMHPRQSSYNFRYQSATSFVRLWRECPHP